MAEKKKHAGIDAAETVGVLIGISLGLLPLIQQALGREQNRIFTWLFGQQDGAAAYLIPALVMAAMIGVIAALEAAKRKRA